MRSILANGVLVYIVFVMFLGIIVENFGKNSLAVLTIFGFFSPIALWSLTGIIRSAFKQFISRSSSVTQRLSAFHAVLISLVVLGPAALLFLLITYQVFKILGLTIAGVE